MPWRLLAEHGAKAKILAGGTDLLVELKHAVHNPQVIVDVSRLRELKTIAVADDGLHIGALATHGDIMASPIIRDMFPALVDAAHSIGAVQTRNLGTLGGNLITCVPSMDSGPTLIALEATLTVASASGQRQMPLAELFVGPRKTSLKPGDLLVDIVIPKENLDKPAGFEKFGLRKGQALALVNAAAAFFIDKGKFSGAAHRARRGRARRSSARPRRKPISMAAPSAPRRWPKPAASPRPKQSRSTISAPAPTTGAISSPCW